MFTKRPDRKLMTIVIVLLAVVAIQNPAAAVGPTVSAPREQAIVDTLGVDPTTTFSIFGSAGSVVSATQVIGPRFTLQRRTRLTEIGAFLNNCEQIAEPARCRDTGPFTVQIHPEKNGVPDPGVVVVTLVLSHDNDPFVVRYESVRPQIPPLNAGTYFALFAPQREQDVGMLLGNANFGAYVAGRIDLAYITPAGAFDAGVVPAAVRILGVPLGTRP